MRLAQRDRDQPSADPHVAKRATAQSQMMGEKLLRQRAGVDDLSEHDFAESIDKLTSQLHHHGHPINRQEAKDDLRLSFVESASRDVESAMWSLYEAYATSMRLDDEFDPLAGAHQFTNAPAPPRLNPQAPVPVVHHVALDPLVGAVVESADRCDEWARVGPPLEAGRGAELAPARRAGRPDAAFHDRECAHLPRARCSRRRPCVAPPQCFSSKKGEVRHRQRGLPARSRRLRRNGARLANSHSTLKPEDTSVERSYDGRFVCRPQLAG